MQRGEPKNAFANVLREWQIRHWASYSRAISTSSENDYVARTAGRHHLWRVCAQNDLKLWTLAGNATKIAHQRVLKLRMQVSFRLFDHDRGVKQLREE